MLRRQVRAARATAGPAARERYHHGDLRRALIDTALELARRRGPAAFSFADLCREVGVSTAAPYRHFESLDQLMAEAAREGFAQLDRLIGDGLVGADWRARLASCTQGYLGFVRQHPGHVIAMFEARAQTVADPHWDPMRPLDLPAPRGATEASVYECWRAGAASFNLYARAVAQALADSPLAPAVATKAGAVETALALWTVMQGIAWQWIDRSLPDDWLDRGARKAFEKIVLPWALGVAEQCRASVAGAARTAAAARGKGRRAPPRQKR
jgi:AcrR family transcriptional regulator